MSRILVTGGAGFIGSHVVEALEKADHEICVMDDFSSGSFANLRGHSFYNHDIAILSSYMGEIFRHQRFNAVIHLAAQPSLQTSWKRADFDAQTNIIGTINLLGLCQRYKVRKFIFASTSAVYGPNPSGVYSEDDPIRPQSPYGAGKAAAEHYVRISRVPYMILRLGNVYGPRQVPLGENQLIPRALAHIYQRKPFQINGSGEQRRDFVYVEDVARAFVKATKPYIQGTFNIATGESFTVNDVLKTICWLIDRQINWKRGPAKRGEHKKVVLDSSEAYRSLNWKPEIKLPDGLWRTIEAWPK